MLGYLLLMTKSLEKQLHRHSQLFVTKMQLYPRYIRIRGKAGIRRRRRERPQLQYQQSCSYSSNVGRRIVVNVSGHGTPDCDVQTPLFLGKEVCSDLHPLRPHEHWSILWPLEILLFRTCEKPVLKSILLLTQ